MEGGRDNVCMEIQNVFEDDVGEYVCEAVNRSGTAESTTEVVMVTPQERRTWPSPLLPTHQRVLEFHLEVDDSSKSPSPQGISVEVEMQGNEVGHCENQIKIVAVPRNRVGNKNMEFCLDFLPCTCEEKPFDFIKQETDDLTIAFELTEMPLMFTNPICDIEASENSNAVFECSLVGCPAPAVFWFKGGLRIPHDGHKYIYSSEGDKHLLEIVRVSTCDSGIYTCKAVNRPGEMLCMASLFVLDSQTSPEKEREKIAEGNSEVTSQKLDFDVISSPDNGDEASEIELEFEFGHKAEEPQKGVRLVATSNCNKASWRECLLLNIFSEAAEDEKIVFDVKHSDTCSCQFSADKASLEETGAWLPAVRQLRQKVAAQRLKTAAGR
ncbi:titin homolog [Arapaima gigas]